MYESCETLHIAPFQNSSLYDRITKKIHRKDKAYQDWIVYVETFFCTLLLQLSQLHENKKPNGPCT